MSSKRRKNVPRSSAYVRGPSRPVDQRRGAGGYPPRGYQRGYGQRGGFSPFAMGLVAVVGFALVVLLVILAVQNANKSSPATAAQQNTGTGSTGSNGGAASPDWTQTTVAFSTQTAPDVVPRITIQQVKALYDANNVKIVDVRLKTLYNQGHIKGAANVPQAEVGTHIKDLPKTGNLVLYCDCPHDEESAGTAYSLKTAGYTNVKVLQGPTAYTEWKNAGYPIEQATP